MKFIQPISVTAEKIAQSTASADSESAYSSSVTYSLGVRVKSGDRIYKSLQASNVGHPVSDASWWSDVGPSNKMAMFDSAVSTQTVGSGSMVVEIITSSVDQCDSIAIVNVYADSVTVDVVVNGSVTHSETKVLSTLLIDNWYDYFFALDSRDTRAVFTIPPTSVGNVRLTFTGGTIRVGACIVGYSKSVGLTRMGGSRELVDYSRASADEFGEWTLTRRNFASNGSFQCEVARDAANAVFNSLADVRGVPTLWSGVEDDEFTTIFGILGKVRGDLSTKSTRYFTVEIKGMAT